MYDQTGKLVHIGGSRTYTREGALIALRNANCFRLQTVFVNEKPKFSLWKHGKDIIKATPGKNDTVILSDFNVKEVF